MDSFPLRHLSIRVPWHDSGWKGVGVKPESEEGGPNGMLVTSEGSGSTAFNASEIQATIRRLF